MFFGRTKNSRQNIFDNWSGVWKEKLTEKYLTIVVVVGGSPKIYLSFYLSLEGQTFCQEKVTIGVVFGRRNSPKKDLTIVVVVVVVGGTNSRPRIDVISICLWKDKCFAQRIDNCLTRKS